MTDVFTVTREIKSSLLKKSKEFKTYKQLIDFVESTIVKSGFEPAFPTNIAPDYIVSNWTPLLKDITKPLIYQVCTVDFGVLDKNGLITDTAITLSNTPYWVNKLEKYRALIKLIQSKINNLYIIKGFIYSDEITDIVELVFKNTQFYIIPECAAHTITKNLLHAETILMSGRGVPNIKLSKGDYFTLEPHVSIGPGEVTLEPGTIFLDLKSNKYDTLDDRLNLGSDHKKISLYSYVKSTSKSFYEENTYHLEENLVNCTSV